MATHLPSKTYSIMSVIAKPNFRASPKTLAEGDEHSLFEATVKADWAIDLALTLLKSVDVLDMPKKSSTPVTRDTLTQHYEMLEAILPKQVAVLVQTFQRSGDDCDKRSVIETLKLNSAEIQARTANALTQIADF